MTDWTHRTIIVPAAYAPMARALAEAAGPAGSGAGMFQAMLSPTAGKPPTHYISAGLIWPEFAYLLPTHDSEMWVQPEPVEGQEPVTPATPPVDSAGHPAEVVALAINAKAAQVEKALIAALPQSDEPTPPEQLEAIKAQAQQLAQASPPVTLAQVQALFSACRVYTCGWQQAVTHLGLKSVVEVMQ